VIFKIDFEKDDGSIRWDFVEEVQNYMMSMFQLYGEVHQQMDTIRIQLRRGRKGIGREMPTALYVGN
jgi:hypothetical protein